ncbi:MAG: ThuA domain-containing protein [Planctomycetota bacterium]
MSRKTSQSPPAVAVVTGGHSYDVPNFHKLFRAIPGVDCYIQHIDDFASSPRQVREKYDVVLFYIMLMDGPKDEGQPWYAGKPKTALEELGATEQGIFVLHHAILAYPQWPVWSELVGIADRKFGYHDGQALHVGVANQTHPITQGLRAWDMTDETYTMSDAGAGSEILLAVEHPKSMKTVGWTRQYRKSRVFNFQLGHDNAAWSDPNFREVVRRGILWCAGRL